MYCQIDYLRRCLPPRVRHALDELPETLDGTYDRALREIDKANWEISYRLLQCVAVASRPLCVEELAEILSFDFKTGPVPKFNEGWRSGDPVDAVLSTTSSLLAIVDSRGSRVIQFSHFSVKEYLTAPRLAETNTISRYHISLTLAHTLTARACLGILLHLDEHVVNQDDLKEYPLAEYAAKQWVDHARFEGVSEYVEDGMKALFNPSKLHLAICIWIYDPVSRSQFRQPERPFQHRRFPLQFAAFWGFHAIVEFLIIEHSQDVHSRSFDDESTALHMASRGGHEDVVHLLLEHGAELSAQDKDGRTALHLASENGHEKVALLLLEHGAELSAQDKDGRTALHLASKKGREKIALLLLEHGAELSAQDKDGRTALHVASDNGHEKVALLLLEHGAEASAQDKDGWTVLHSASRYGHEKFALLLLEHGAEPSAQDKHGLTALHLASKYGREKVALLLLEHGTEASAQDKDGRTALHFASQNGHEKVALLLLEHGADETAQTNTGLTPLHVVVRHGRAEAVGSFLECGADVTAQLKDGSTFLHLASRWGNVDVVRLLFKHGVDATALNHYGWNALHLASHWGHLEVARFLLDHGADPRTQNKYGWTPLRLALQGGHVEVARLLGERGADTTDIGEQLAPLSQVALDQEDLGLARMFEPEADVSHASDHTKAWSSIIGFMTIIIVTCFIFRARAIFRYVCRSSCPKNKKSDSIIGSNWYNCRKTLQNTTNLTRTFHDLVSYY